MKKEDWATFNALKDIVDECASEIAQTLVKGSYFRFSEVDETDGDVIVSYYDGYEDTNFKFPAEYLWRDDFVQLHEDAMERKRLESLKRAELSRLRMAESAERAERELYERLKKYG